MEARNASGEVEVGTERSDSVVELNRDDDGYNDAVRNTYGEYNGQQQPEDSEEECRIDLAAEGYCACADDWGCGALERMDAEFSVRVQAGPDPCLSDVETEEDVWRRIDAAREEQEGRCGGIEGGLYERRWLPVGRSPAGKGSERFTGGDQATAVPSFTAMQFNVLAEGLSSAPRTYLPPPFGSDARDDGDRGGGKIKGYGGFTAVPRPEVVLDFGLRRWRLLEVLLGRYCRNATGANDADAKAASDSSPLPFDIVALEELDRYHGFFRPLLHRVFGYRSVFVPKPHAPGVELGYYSDGTALFWSDARFQLVESNAKKFTVGNQVYLTAVLRHRGSGRDVVVGCTHLKAKKGRDNERVRAAQAAELLGALEDARVWAAEAREGIEPEDVPVLLLGDFNAEPYGECVCTVLGHQETKLTSAYDLDEEGAYTTWKTRGANTVRRTIDYIFHSGESACSCTAADIDGEDTQKEDSHRGKVGKAAEVRRRFRCTHVLSVPSPDEVEPHGLPGVRQPSDHFALAARFEL